MVPGYVFLLHLLIAVLHFSGFILPAHLHLCCIGIKYFVSGMMHGPSSACSALKHSTGCVQAGSRGSLGSCTCSGVCCECCVVQISLALLAAVLGKCSSLAPCSRFLHRTQHKWGDAHHALFVFSLWVGQIPFVFQQVKRTSCFIVQVFCWGFVGQDMIIYYPKYCCLLNSC